MIADSLKLDGHNYNRKKIYRIYDRLNLQLDLRKFGKKKIPARKKIYEIAERNNEIWSLDFMYIGVQSARTLNVIDEFNREVLAMKAGAFLL